MSSCPGLTLIVVDPSVQNYSSLIETVQSDTQIVILDSDQDSIQQITQALEQHSAESSGINSLHILSHGQSGTLHLGAIALNLETLNRYARQLQSWQNLLAEHANILLYGCNVAAADRGQTFVQKLAQLTCTPIAASKTLTGSAALGGNWNLEFTTGKISAPLAFQPEAMAAYAGVLAIDMTGSTGWKAVVPANQNQYDYTTDQQTGSGSVSQDIVGNSTTDPAFYTAFDGTDLAFRIRVNDRDGQATPEFGNFAWIGLDADRNGSIDLFLGVFNPAANNGKIGIWSSDPNAANVSPSTTGIGNELLVHQPTAGEYNFAEVTTHGVTSSNFSGDADYFISFKLAFSDIVAQLAARGIAGVTTTTPLRYIIGTSTQTNTFNQDVSGINGPFSGLTTSWKDLGAYTPFLTADGTPVTSLNNPVNTVPGAQTTPQNTALAFSTSNKISVTDDQTTLTVTLTATHGTLTLASTSGLTISSGSNGSAAITFSGTETAINTALNGLQFVPTTGYNGAATLQIQTSDGTNSDTDSVNITVGTPDTTPPTVSLSTTAPATVNAPFTVTATFSEAVTNFVAGDVVLANGSISNFSGSGTTYTFTVTPTTEGTVTIAVPSAVAQDGAGNNNTAATQLTRTFDGTAPTVGVNTLTSNDTTPALTGTVDDPAAVVKVTIAGQTYTATNKGDGTWNLADNAIAPALADGTYNVQVTATDAAGNVGNDATTNELIIDTTAPVVGINVLTSNDSTPALTGTVDDPAAVVKVTIAGQTYTANNKGDGTWSLADNTIAPALADNTYDVQVSATDAAGNVGNDATTNELTINTTVPDTTPPTVALSSAAATVVNAPFTVTATFSEAVTNFVAGDVVLANGSISNFSGSGTTYTFTVTPTADGVVTVDVASAVAQDGAGNDNTAATQLTRTFDGTAPTVGVNTLTSNDTTPALTGTVDDPAAVVKVTIAGQTYTATNKGDGTWNLADNAIAPALADGTYNVQVTATDAAGNVGNDATSNELTINTTVPDTTPPTVSLSTTAPATVNAPFTVTATFSEAVTNFVSSDITITNGNISNFSGSGTTYTFTVTPTADGVVTVDVASAVAQDAANNNNTAATQLTRTFDGTAPVVGVNTLTSNDSTPALTGTVNDPTAVVQVTVGGQTYTATNKGDGTWSLADNTIAPALADGTYNVQVTATDAAGNVGNDATTNELVINTTVPDTTPPIVSVNPLSSNDSTPALSGLVDDPTAIVKVKINNVIYTAINQGNGTWSLPDNTIAPALLNGTYDLEVTATDAAGNTGKDSSLNELTIKSPVPPPPPAPEPTPVPEPTPAASLPPTVADTTQPLAPGRASSISGLIAQDIDGSIVSYTILSIPSADQGILFLGDPAKGGIPITIGQELEAAQISQLFFQAAAGFKGASFTYTAKDNSGAIDSTPATILLSLLEVSDACGSSILRVPGLRKNGNQKKDKFQGSQNDDRVDGKKGNDILLGRDGHDWLQGGRGKDRLFGGTGRDKLQGGQDNDRLFGDAGVDTLSGGQGNDRLDGGACADRLMGGKGKDRLLGADGNDVLMGGLDNDRLRGGQGNDTLNGGRSDDRLQGGDGDDRLKGGQGKDRLQGNTGNDFLQGSGNNDSLTGQAGDDTLQGGKGNDRLRGQSGNDYLLGGAKRDLLQGQSGNDVLVGGQQGDTLIGGAGADQFVYNSAIEVGDRILKFQVTEDRLHLSSLFAKATYSDPDRFNTYIQIAQVGTDTQIKVDCNGDLAGGFKTLAILVKTDASSLNSSQFIL